MMTRITVESNLDLKLSDLLMIAYTRQVNGTVPEGICVSRSTDERGTTITISLATPEDEARAFELLEAK